MECRLESIISPPIGHNLLYPFRSLSYMTNHSIPEDRTRWHN